MIVSEPLEPEQNSMRDIHPFVEMPTERDHSTGYMYDDRHRTAVSDGLLSMTLFEKLYREVL